MFWSFCYIVLRRVQLAALRLRSREFKELENVVLRPWFFIDIRHGRVSDFYFASTFVD